MKKIKTYSQQHTISLLTIGLVGRLMIVLPVIALLWFAIWQVLV